MLKRVQTSGGFALTALAEPSGRYAFTDPSGQLSISVLVKDLTSLDLNMFFNVQGVFNQSVAPVPQTFNCKDQVFKYNAESAGGSLVVDIREAQNGCLSSLVDYFNLGMESQGLPVVLGPELSLLFEKASNALQIVLIPGMPFTLAAMERSRPSGAYAFSAPGGTVDIDLNFLDQAHVDMKLLFNLPDVGVPVPLNADCSRLVYGWKSDTQDVTLDGSVEQNTCLGDALSSLPDSFKSNDGSIKASFDEENDSLQAQFGTFPVTLLADNPRVVTGPPGGSETTPQPIGGESTPQPGENGSTTTPTTTPSAAYSLWLSPCLLSIFVRFLL